MCLSSAQITNYLLTENEVLLGKSQTKTLLQVYHSIDMAGSRFIKIFLVRPNI